VIVALISEVAEMTRALFAIPEKSHMTPLGSWPHPLDSRDETQIPPKFPRKSDPFSVDSRVVAGIITSDQVARELI
jgi:hypothetical protein